MEEVIYFYTKTDKYGDFSNFAKLGFELEGAYWKTVEHYFQAMKFHDLKYREKIRLAHTAKEARNLGRSREFSIRNDWDERRIDVMRMALEYKFKSNSAARNLLLSTHNSMLVESSPFDYYWGCGGDGSGENMLGKLLMELREQLLDGN